VISDALYGQSNLDTLAVYVMCCMGKATSIASFVALQMLETLIFNGTVRLGMSSEQTMK
jgi:hypothetical protein